MRMVFRYLAPYKARLSVGFTIKVLGTLVELFIPYILSHILEKVVVRESIAEILLWGSLMIGCALAACILNVIANRMAARVTRNFSERMRSELFRKTMLLSARQTDAFTVASLESRITSDTYNVHNFVGMMQRMGVRAPILLIGGIIITMIMDLWLSLVMVAMLPLIFVITYLISRRGVPLYTGVQRSADNMIRVVREDAQGIRVIKALSKTEHENSRYDEVNKRLSRDERHAGTVMSIVNPVMTLLMNGGITAVVALSAIRVTSGSSSPETVIAFIQYFTLISMAMMTLSRIFVMYTKCAASARRINEVIETEEDKKLIESAPEKTENHIEFCDVSFGYNKDAKHLRNISFSLKRGGKLGIIGATGSGKSTIIRLLLRQYDVFSGRILIDGKDVRSIPRGELSAMFGVAFQNDFLYADTVRENIDIGRDLADADVERGARIAQASEFIEATEDGYNHALAQKASNLSGGQKQRLLIARAIAGRPEILILDDSSSALDYRTDAALRRALDENLSETTVITVAQRVSSVKDCDLILVIDEGEIIGKGTHEELMSNCLEYREISDSQMGGAIVD